MMFLGMNIYIFYMFLNENMHLEVGLALKPRRRQNIQVTPNLHFINQQRILWGILVPMAALPRRGLGRLPLHRRVCPDAGLKAPSLLVPYSFCPLFPMVRPSAGWVVPYPLNQHHPLRPFEVLCHVRAKDYSCRGNALTPAVFLSLVTSASSSITLANTPSAVHKCGALKVFRIS